MGNYNILLMKKEKRLNRMNSSQSKVLKHYLEMGQWLSFATLCEMDDSGFTGNNAHVKIYVIPQDISEIPPHSSVSVLQGKAITVWGKVFNMPTLGLNNLRNFD